MAVSLRYVRTEGLVHGISPFVPNITGCGFAFIAQYEITDAAPTCLRCIYAEGNWQAVVARAIKRAKRQK